MGPAKWIRGALCPKGGIAGPGWNEYIQTNWCLKTFVYALITTVSTLVVMKYALNPMLWVSGKIPVLGGFVSGIVQNQIFYPIIMGGVTSKLGVHEAICHVAGIDERAKQDGMSEREVLEQNAKQMKLEVEKKEQDLEDMLHSEREKYNETATMYNALQKHVQENDHDPTIFAVMAIVFCVAALVLMFRYCRESATLIQQAESDLAQMAARSDDCPA